MAKRISEKDLKTALQASESALRNSLGRLTGSNDIGGRVIGFGKQHPLALTLAGASLTWIAYSVARSPTSNPSAEALTRWEDEGGLPVDTGEISDQGMAWLTKARAARDNALARLSALYEQGIATAEHQATVAQELGADLSDAFRDSLSGLPGDAADKVAEARETAWRALNSGQAKAEDQIKQAAETIRHNPVTATVAGLGIGALMALLVPKSRPVLQKTLPLAASALMAQAASFFAPKAQPAEDTLQPQPKSAKRAQPAVGKTNAATSRAKAPTKKPARKSAANSQSNAGKRTGASAGPSADLGGATAH